MPVELEGREEKSFKAMVPNLFGTGDQFQGRQFFHRPGDGRGVWIVSGRDHSISDHQA